MSLDVCHLDLVKVYRIIVLESTIEIHQYYDPETYNILERFQKTLISKNLDQFADLNSKKDSCVTSANTFPSEF